MRLEAQRKQRWDNLYSQKPVVPSKGDNDTSKVYMFSSAASGK